MTRINCGIEPEELSNKHLFAEIREMKRIPNNIKKGKFDLQGVPAHFTLGTGHIKFFYDKLKYLHNRHTKLVREWVSRGYRVSDYSGSYENLPEHLYNEYTPTDRDRELVLNRLKQKDYEFYKDIV